MNDVQTFDYTYHKSLPYHICLRNYLINNKYTLGYYMANIDYISIYCKQKSMNLFLLLLIIISTLRLIPCLVIFERMNIRWHFQIFWTSVKSNLGKFITLFPFMYFVRLSKQIEMVARMKKLCGLSHCRHKRDNFEYIN